MPPACITRLVPAPVLVNRLVSAAQAWGARAGRL